MTETAVATAPDDLVGRLVTDLGWAVERARATVEQAECFLAVAAAAPGLLVVPSVDVDEVWHRWLAMPSYRAFCEAHGGLVSHHRADEYTDGAVLHRAYAATRSLLARGAAFDEAAWTARADCWGNCPAR